VNSSGLQTKVLRGKRDEEITNPQTGTCALTWGVFPHREIIQPTVFDPDTFLVWKDEAFLLWKTVWADTYEEDSHSYDLLESVFDTFYLVAIIDDAYVDGDEKIWKLLSGLDQGIRK